MNVQKTNFEGLLVLTPEIFEDSRGFFFESYNKEKFSYLTGINQNFVQDNHSFSKKNVLRGLHFQVSPKSQGKLVRVLRGSVFDVVVDLREKSETFGNWFGIKLSEKNKKQIWIPKHFAHGFLSLSENVHLSYKTTDYYSPKHERCLLWNDKSLSIKWPIKGEINISKKDLKGMSFNKFIKENRK